MSSNTQAPAYSHVGANVFSIRSDTRIEFPKRGLKFLIGNAFNLARTQFLGATFEGRQRDRFAKRRNRIFKQFISQPNPLGLWKCENHLANCS